MNEAKDNIIVESPCVRNCCLDRNDICLGCFRSLTEIMQWTLVDEYTRQEFIRNAEKRNINNKVTFIDG